ncbi:PREDICTED: polyserase-2-like [Acromyrmex echinatior]|nr:PREDICTED: polyserase-2-like [Acromyrmex echinatior]
MLIQYLFIVLAFHARLAIPFGLKLRITDGENAIPGEFSYQVSLQWGLPPILRFSHICGGSIVHESFVLTAGHCIMIQGEFKVIVGKYYLLEDEETQQEIEVAKIYVHENYPGGIAPYDIALLKLKTPLTFNKWVSAIKLPEQDEVQVGNAILSGWGSVSKTSVLKLSNVLQKVTVPLLDSKSCQDEFSKSYNAPQLYDSQICTAAIDEISACSGDSGGPLVQFENNVPTLVGITSWGTYPCGISHKPSVYTRVASYTIWIKKIIWIIMINYHLIFIDNMLEMFPKAIVFFALLTVAVAERLRVGLQMPPILPRFTGPISVQVVGGEEAPVGYYPFIASLQMFNSHFCAGSIINKEWILTAAHCANAGSLNFLRVKVGKHNIQKNESTEQTVQVAQAYIHENYEDGVGPYDIALLKLATPLKLTKEIQAIELPPPESEPTGEAWLCGWGSISTDRYPIMPDKLQHVKMEYLDLITCHESIERLIGYSPVHETNVCTGPLYDQISACSGDSGGPLISRIEQKPVLIGIVSWGIIPCGSTGAPSIYTKVSSFIEWIEKKKRPKIGLRMPPIFPPFNRSISSQVVGGEEAGVGSYPFIVSLQIFSQHFCAGSILNEKWIITAGHCINSVPSILPLSILRVKAGKYNLQLIENTEQTVKVVKAYVHENYKRGIGPYDIGLLKLASPLKLNNNVQAIELAPPESEPTGKAWLCGWGSISTTNYPIMPNKLQHVKIEYINRTTCHESVKRLTGSSPVHETNICTGPLYNKISACSGDSGGPLISYNGKKSVLTGIVSWGIVPCGTLGAPSVYTKIIIVCQRTVAPAKKSIKCGLFYLGLSLNSKMYSKAIVFFAFLAMAVANDTSDSTSFETRVVGGKPAATGQYPFIVSLQLAMGRQPKHFCAASILNKLWVLSAAHCGKGISASRITVKAGKNNLKVKEAAEQTVKVLKVYIHEKYKGGVGPYDIALFKLATPLKMNKNVQAIKLAQPNSIPTGNVWLCGWGSTSTSISPIMPDKLQHVMLKIMDLKSCNQTIIKLTRSSSLDKTTNICTGSPNRKSSCSGDSGGPLFKIINGKPVLVGIVSWGMIPCGFRGAPSVYTKVSNFNKWIAQKMRN